MDHPPRISIITPSYNQGVFLEQTIMSVLEQNYPALEYLVMDGGSQDSSVSIIEKYQNRITHWESTKDRGQAHAINKGLSNCTGEIIAWINSDDLYALGTLAWAAGIFSAHPEIDFIYGDAEIIDARGTRLKHRRELPFDRLMGDLIGWGLLIPQPAAFWRRRVYDEIGGLNERLQYALDAEYWYRISRRFRMIHFDRLNARQRYHTSSKTQRGFQDDPRHRIEEEMLRRRSYESLAVSRIIPYRFSGLVRNGYRLKRILQRLLLGHYFQDYVPEPLLRQRM